MLSSFLSKLSQYAPSLGSWFGGSSESPYASSLSSMMGELRNNLPAPVPKAPGAPTASYAPTSSSSFNPMDLLRGAESLTSYAPSPYAPSTLWNNASQRFSDMGEYGKNAAAGLINRGIGSMVPSEYQNMSVQNLPQFASQMGGQYGGQYGSSHVPSFMQGAAERIGGGAGSYAGHQIGNMAANQLSRYIPEELQEAPLGRMGRPLIDYAMQQAPSMANAAMSGMGKFAKDMTNWGISKATGIPGPITSRLTPYLPSAANYGFNALRGLSNYMPSMSQLMSRGDEQFD